MGEQPGVGADPQRVPGVAVAARVGGEPADQGQTAMQPRAPSRRRRRRRARAEPQRAAGALGGRGPRSVSRAARADRSSSLHLVEPVDRSGLPRRFALSAPTTYRGGPPATLVGSVTPASGEPGHAGGAASTPSTCRPVDRSCTRRSPSPATSRRRSRPSGTPTSPPGTTGARWSRSRTGWSGSGRWRSTTHSAVTPARSGTATRAVSADQQAMLDALTKTPRCARRVIVLVQLGGASLADAAREVGVTQHVAEQHLQTATATLAAEPRHRPGQPAGLAGGARRSGHRQRHPPPGVDHPPGRSQAPPGAHRRRRARRRPGRCDQWLAWPTSRVRPPPAPRWPSDPAPPARRSRRTPARRCRPPTTSSTRTRSAGSARARPGRSPTPTTTPAATGSTPICQRARFADEDGMAAIVREFAGHGKQRRGAVQTVEVSKSATQAQRRLRDDPRLVRRLPGRPAPAARRLPGGQHRRRGLGADDEGLGQAVDDVLRGGGAHRRRHHLHRRSQTSGRPAAGRGDHAEPGGRGARCCAPAAGPTDCAKAPGVQRRAAAALGEERGLLAVADLPPVGGIAQAVGGHRGRGGAAEPVDAPPATGPTSSVAGASKPRARTYLIPEAELARAVRAVGDLRPVQNPARGAAFLDGVRSQGGQLRGPRPGLRRDRLDKRVLRAGHGLVRWDVSHRGQRAETIRSGSAS